jgi:Ras-related protein Rab-11A
LGSIPTMGLDNMHKTVQLSEGSLINCQIYDTAGQEKYKALNTTYYKRADAVLLVYDITKKKSFENVRDFYIPTIKEKCKKEVIVILLGNKLDLEKNREVTSEEGIELAEKENFEFKESSCVHNQNVSGAFETLAERWNFLNYRTEKGEKEPKNRLKRSNTICYKGIKKNNSDNDNNDKEKCLKSSLTYKEKECNKSKRIILNSKPIPKKEKCC